MRLVPLNGPVGRLLDFSGSEGLSTAPEGRPWQIGTPMLAGSSQDVNDVAGVPNWGACDILHVRYAGAAILEPGRLVHVDKNFRIADAPNTAGTGVPLYVTLTRFAVGNVTEQVGFVLRSGICPVQYAVAATAGAMYVGGAGQATPTAAAGKQILNARCLIAAATTFTRQIYTQNGSNLVRTPDVGGMFIGQTVSGTGVPASSEITAIDQSGQSFTMSELATASGTVTGTFTPTGFGICQLDRAFVQGQVT